jgi:hypothetical protein
MPAEYAVRIEAVRQSLQIADLEALSKACRCLPMELVFLATGSDGAGSADPFLDRMVVAEVTRYRDFLEVLIQEVSPRQEKRAKSAA